MKWEELSAFANQSEKYEVLYTIITHSLEKQKLIDDLYDRLKKIKHLSNIKKKKLINDRLFGLISVLKEDSQIPDTLDHVILLDSESHLFALGKRQKHTLAEFNVRPLLFWADTHFRIETLREVITVKCLIDVIQIKAYQLTHYRIDHYKQKTIHEHSLEQAVPKALDHLQQYITKELVGTGKDRGCLVYGVSPVTKALAGQKSVSIPDIWETITQQVDNQQLMEHYHRYQMLRNHQDLSQVFKMLQNPNECDKVIYGAVAKEIKQAIEEYRVKTMFVHQKIKTEFEAMIKDNQLGECLNFQLVWIDTLEKNDTADNLYQQYGGSMGVTYY